MIVQRTEIHIIKESNPVYNWILEECLRSRNLYNRVLYVYRQAFTGKHDNIPQDDASIVETFNLAGTGKVGGSGSGSDPTYGLLKIIFVDALPPISEAKENTLYFVPKDGAAPDNYDEYIFDPVNQQFELVGQSAIDTSDFAKLSSTNIFLAPNTFNEIITFKRA